jgi:hypothetical protein
MAEDRRRASRFEAPAGIEATVSGAPVRLLDLSSVGARVEHEERFPLTSAHLHITWRGQKANISIRAARSEIIGRRETRLVYATGVQFVDVEPPAESVIASILSAAQGGASPSVVQEELPPISPINKVDEDVLDDSWIRQVFTRDDLEEGLPYSQFRLTENGWVKSYVATPQQPSDGFTIERGDMEFHELQRTFESVDPDTRRMMQIALESKLMAAKK